MASWKRLWRKSHLSAVCLQHPSVNKGTPITNWPLFGPCQSIYPEAHHSQQKPESTSKNSADFWFASNTHNKQSWNAKKTMYNNSSFKCCKPALFISSSPLSDWSWTSIEEKMWRLWGFHSIFINSFIEKDVCIREWAPNASQQQETLQDKDQIDSYHARNNSGFVI